MPMVLDPALYQGKPIPLCYELAFDSPLFLFSAQPEVVAVDLKPFDESEGMFFVDEEKLGFDGVFERADNLSPGDGFVTWLAELPVKVIGGSKKSARIARQISQTLEILCFKLQFADSLGISTQLQQLAFYRLSSTDRGYGISATLSPVFRNWVENNREIAHNQAQAEMISAARRMWPSYFTGGKSEREYATRSFRVSHHFDDNLGLILQVAGNACDLGVDGMDLDDGPGWHLEPHNIDGPTQQLTLLSGIATMTRLVRESLSKPPLITL